MATRYGNGGGKGRRITDFEDQPLTDEVEKGWGADLTGHAAGAARKAKIRAGLASRAKDRATNASWAKDYPDDPHAMRQIMAEDDFDRRSNRKSINFVERFKYDPESGSRRLANPKYKTSPPRQRSLTPSDKDYLGFPGGSGHGAGQGVGRSGGSNPNYQFTGNKRVRKAFVANGRQTAGLAASAAGSGFLIGTARQAGKDTDKRIAEAKNKPVGKAARHYDPEHARQRRMGMYEAGLAGGGAASAAYGVHGVVGSTKKLGPAGKITQKWKDNPLKGITAVRPRHAGAIGVGAAAVAGAGAIRHQSGNRRKGTWR